MIDIVNSVQHYQPVFWNVDNSGLLESRRAAIEHDNTENKIAQEAATELAGAINSLDINENYRYVKTELFNQLDGLINSTLQNYNGSLRYAVNDLMTISRDVLKSPKITGLVETNQQYKKWEQELRARTDISDDIKEMIISENPYTFNLKYKKDGRGNDIVDTNGNKIEIGYDDWEPTTYAVKQYDLNEYFKAGLSYINGQQKSSQYITYYDADHNIITGDDITNARYYSVNGDVEEEITDERIASALYAAFAGNSQVHASIMQDYKLAKWKYNNDDNTYGFTKEDGTLKSPNEYIVDLLTNIADAHGYKNTSKIRGHLQALISYTKANNVGGGTITTDRDTPAIQAGNIHITESPATDEVIQEGIMNEVEQIINGE